MNAAVGSLMWCIGSAYLLLFLVLWIGFRIDFKHRNKEEINSLLFVHSSHQPCNDPYCWHWIEITVLDLNEIKILWISWPREHCIIGRYWISISLNSYLEGNIITIKCLVWILFLFVNFLFSQWHHKSSPLSSVEIGKFVWYFMFLSILTMMICYFFHLL